MFRLRNRKSSHPQQQFYYGIWRQAIFPNIVCSAFCFCICDIKFVYMSNRSHVDIYVLYQGHRNWGAAPKPIVDASRVVYKGVMSTDDRTIINRFWIIMSECSCVRLGLLYVHSSDIKAKTTTTTLQKAHCLWIKYLVYFTCISTRLWYTFHYTTNTMRFNLKFLETR